MLLESFYVEHLISQPLLKYKWKYAGAVKCMNKIPLNTHSYYVTALETEVATIVLLWFWIWIFVCLIQMLFLRLMNPIHDQPFPWDSWKHLSLSTLILYS